MSYSHAWGQGGSESQTITVGSTANVSVELDPGESVKALLTASRGVMKVQIVYHANVIGNVVVDYSKGYKGHHYWCFDVSEIRASIDNNDPLEFKEDIEIGFFANADVELEDHDESTTNKDKKKDEQNGTSKKLNCDGRACNTCGKCVDWQIGGNQETWNWIRKFNSWKDGDWDRWRNDGVCKSFIKGDGATCKDVAECGSEEGSARYHSYIFLVHVCFCQPRLKAEGGQQAPNACTQQ
ncbi:unnamed protein product [Adineta steineri]|uniref:Uncharacterized protein n=1 Tax=Adineta steineri TaxID=433720 RepID=A0A815Q0M6_9BILA|nr:unnamed protein product [Adineta steineri]CAF1632170.1 unnamed protein product [Adineta steineri]